MGLMLPSFPNQIFSGRIWGAHPSYFSATQIVAEEQKYLYEPFELVTNSRRRLQAIFWSAQRLAHGGIRVRVPRDQMRFFQDLFSEFHPLLMYLEEYNSDFEKVLTYLSQYYQYYINIIQYLYHLPTQTFPELTILQFHILQLDLLSRSICFNPCPRTTECTSTSSSRLAANHQKTTV